MRLEVEMTTGASLAASTSSQIQTILVVETFEMWNAVHSEHESDRPEARDAIEHILEQSICRRVRQRRE